MPKNKTHSGASKRFRVTGSGKLRREKAQLLGYPNFAAYVLYDQMAKTPQAAKLTGIMSAAARPEDPS